MLKTSIGKDMLAKYIASQLNYFFPDEDAVKAALLNGLIDKALQRTEFCFSKIGNRHYRENNKVFFNHLNSDQYAVFLYYLANLAWRAKQNFNLPAKIYYLNKSLNCVDIYYEVEMPDIFQLIHPVGSVLGRAKYSDYFVAHQGVVVGANKNDEYPIIGEGVAAYGNSMIIGKSNIADNCLISAGTIVIDAAVPSGTVVFGRHPNIEYKKTSRSVKQRFFTDY